MTFTPYDDGSQNETSRRKYHEEPCHWCGAPRVGDSEFCEVHARAAAIEFSRKGGPKSPTWTDYELEAKALMNQAEAAAFWFDSDDTPPARVRVTSNRGFGVIALATEPDTWTKADGGAWMDCPTTSYAEAYAKVLTEAGYKAKVFPA